MEEKCGTGGRCTDVEPRERKGNVQDCGKGGMGKIWKEESVKEGDEGRRWEDRAKKRLVRHDQEKRKERVGKGITKEKRPSGHRRERED